MEPIFINDFEKREWLGRQGLKELATKFPKTFRYEIKFTPNDYDLYDAWFLMYDEETHQIIKRVFIEIKIRYKVYDSYILEKNKFKNLKKMMKELTLEDGDYKIMYLNFCPNGTYLWDITDLHDKDFDQSIMMNKATSTSRTNKIKKKCMLLEPGKARLFEYIHSEEKIMGDYMKEYILPKIEKKIEQRGFGWLFDE